MDNKSKDKFYTNPDVVKFCGDAFHRYLNIGEREEVVIEPSAGAGAFSMYTDILLDLYPERDDIIKQDFLTWDSSKYKFYLGNPPFGKNSSLAKKFFNHAAKGKGLIGFILPRTFRKVSITNSLNLNFWLVEEYILNRNSFTLEGKPYAVPCVFQIWEYRVEKRNKIILPLVHKDFSFVSAEEADFSIRRVGGNAGKVNPHNNFAAASNYFIKGDCKETFIEIQSILQEISQDTVGNPSIGKGELVLAYTKFKEKENE
tara:strand:+ start:3073 stop:3846 length:774 start_codon:yes stop_codon:yes gene_type:complete